MSGTSLDGLDIAYCEFRQQNQTWQFAVLQAVTVAYPENWVEQLKKLHLASAYDYACMHQQMGSYFGQITKKFIAEHHLQPDFIASHGHTIFHQPQRRLTTQIANGAEIAAQTGLPVVCDFRTTDVALGGQGAPLVPIGDELLFADFDFCLNLGGIANISTKKNGKRIAFDICPVNLLLNRLANLLGKEYDKNGESAAKGSVANAAEVLQQLNDLPFYAEPAPKSLGREWFEQSICPVVDSYLQKFGSISSPSPAVVCDVLAACCQHIALQISQVILNLVNELPKEKQQHPIQLLATGGGAFNVFLIKLLQNYLPKVEVIVPEATIVNYKEALIFAFLGILRWQQQPNCLQAVTGANRDNCGGCIYWA